MNQTSEGSTIKDIVDEKFSAETQVLMMTFFGNMTIDNARVHGVMHA